jgi:hypothetical protein
MYVFLRELDGNTGKVFHRSYRCMGLATRWTLRCRACRVGPEQRAVREAPARPLQGAVQAACGACEGLADDASRSECV